jgi:universal stress protein A
MSASGRFAWTALVEGGIVSGFPRRVLCAVDGSKESDLAVSHTADLVGDTGAEVHVVHVGLVSPWTGSKTLNPQQVERLRQQSRVVLDAQVEKFRSMGLDPTGVHLRMGRATDEILRLRDEVDADLIVMGSRGLNAFKRVLLGSDAEGVIRHAQCAVLVVRRDQ